MNTSDRRAADRDESAAFRGETDGVLVSVVVPVYNDPDGIETTLQSLVDQTFERYEVVAVDNGSTDETKSVVEQFEAQYSDIVTLVEETEVQGSYAARNRGIEAAEGSVLAFLDADMTVGETWLTSAVAAMEEADAAYMACRVIVEPSEGAVTWVERYNVALEFPMSRYVSEHGYAPTCALFVHRQVFDDLGQFDPHLQSGGDNEFGNRVTGGGYSVHYAEDVVAYHPARRSLSEMVGKKIRIGRGERQLETRYPDRYGDRRLLRRLLPPHPIRFRSRIKPESRHGIGGLLILYLFDYVFKLAKVIGYSAESIKSGG